MLKPLAAAFLIFGLATTALSAADNAATPPPPAAVTPAPSGG